MRRRSVAIIDEVEFLLSFGEAPDRISERLGYARGSLYVMLRRWGRPDLAKHFPPRTTYISGTERRRRARERVLSTSTTVR